MAGIRWRDHLYKFFSKTPNVHQEAQRNPNETFVKRIGLAIGVDGREFEAPEFDLSQIASAYDTEGYVRQAVDKYIEMMFKSGWDLVGKNPASIEYIKKRFALMAEMTQIPTDQLFIEIAEDLVKYSNAVIAKRRDKEGFLSGNTLGTKVEGLNGQPPISGYFPLNVTTMSVLRDKNGVIRSWQQEVDGGDKPIKFKPEDIIHIYYKREKGKAFGTPFLLPVLDDIRALRQAEETVLRLIYRNLNPLLHIVVGTDNIPAQESEVEVVRTEFENMDLEAGFVTNERVRIEAIASDKIIDAHSYLKYFEQRVFTGLGVSELMMGRGNTANRSTGDNLSGEFLDRVKAFQRVMAIFVDEFIIKELLMEGGFDPVLNPDDDVDFVFKEIDIDAKIKKENHIVFLYEHNIITEDEARQMLGLDPITDRSKMHMNLVSIPKSNQKEEGSPETNNKNQPQNQHGKKTSPKATKTSVEQKPIHNNVISKINQWIDEIADIAYNTESQDVIVEKAMQIQNHIIDLLQSRYEKAQVNLVVVSIFKDFETQIKRLLGISHGVESKERKQEVLSGILEILRMRLEEAISRLDEKIKESEACQWS